MTSCQGADGTVGTVYSYAQLQGLWINAGGSKVVAPIAAAIALAESGGCSAAINPTDNNGTQTSWGLWQISNGTHAQPVSGIRNPGTNAQQAVAKYTGAGNSFSPWGTYDSGAYKQYVNGSTTPDTSVTATLDSSNSGGGSGGGSGSSAPSPCLLQIGGGSFLGIGNPLNVCLLTRTGAREIVGGLCLVGAGIIGLAAAVILSAAAFQHSGASRVVGQVAAAVPAVRPVARAAGS